MYIYLNGKFSEKKSYGFILDYYLSFIFLTAGLLHRAYPYVYFYCKNGFYVLYDRFIGLITSYNVYL